MEREELIAFLRENLRIEVSTERNYTGDMDGSGSLYANSHTIQLLLDDEIISEASL